MTASRADIVAIARSWIGTPYRHRGRIKGVGCDCAMLAAEVYAEAGLIPPQVIEDYPPDWHLHRDAERYMGHVLRYAAPIEARDAGAGDLVLFQFGRAFAHGGLLTEAGWPHIIHAWQPAGVVLEDRGDGGRLEGRDRRFFTVVGAV